MGEHEALSWRGHEAIDRDGDKLGKIKEIYLDNETDEPEWAVVGIGLLGGKVRFLPLQGATERGGFVRIDVEKDRLDGAPEVDEDAELTADQERGLYEHYGLDYDAPGGRGPGIGGSEHGEHEHGRGEHGRGGDVGRGDDVGGGGGVGRGDDVERGGDVGRGSDVGR